MRPMTTSPDKSSRQFTIADLLWVIFFMGLAALGASMLINRDRPLIEIERSEPEIELVVVPESRPR